MNLFLDTSVILAACASRTRASRALFAWAAANGWTLLTSSYVLNETSTNLVTMPQKASDDWLELQRELTVVPDVFSFEWPVLFVPAKNRPILFTAMAWADVLLTLDRRDFGELVGNDVYGMPALTPGAFLIRECDAGRLVTQ